MMNLLDVVQPFLFSGRYKTVPSNKPQESDEIESKQLLREKYTTHDATSRIPTVWIFLTLSNVVLFGASLLLLMVSQGQTVGDINSALKRVSTWSPVLDSVSIPLHDKVVNGTFLPKRHVSIARNAPSEESDAKWDDFEHIRTLVVSRADIIKLGRDPDKVAKFDDEYWGLGDDAYMAELDVMHQIHCLNSLRKAAFTGYPGYNPVMTHQSESTHWTHLAHCTDILLQSLQCSANTELLTLAWMHNRTTPWPDFSVNRKCRDFDALAKWNNENSVDIYKFGRMPIPRDAYLWPYAMGAKDSELGFATDPDHEKHGHV